MSSTGATNRDDPRPVVGLGNSYEMFIFVLTILSLAIMLLLVMPLPAPTLKLLSIYDNVICFVFLGDFAIRLRKAPRGRDYFIGERGWLDLLGSIPSFGISQYGSLLRLARLSRLARITRLIRGQKKRELMDDVLCHRGEYAAFITFLAALIVLVVASVLVLTFETGAAGANIATGGDALWWTLVTITTVGYGDYFPVTAEGRVTAFFVMLAGVGIIGALASILASVLVAQPAQDTAEPADTAPANAASDAGTAETTFSPSDATASHLSEELAAIRQELAALRASVEATSGRADPPVG